MTVEDDDDRIVFGARCVWWDSVGKAAALRSGLPCCPRCGGVLFETTRGKWERRMKMIEIDHPGYADMMDWARGRCFPTGDARAEAYLAALPRTDPEIIVEPPK